MAKKEAPSIKVGDKIRVKKTGVIFGTKAKFASWVYEKELFVRGIEGKKVLFAPTTNGLITGAIDVKYIDV